MRLSSCDRHAHGIQVQRGGGLQAVRMIHPLIFAPCVYLFALRIIRIRTHSHLSTDKPDGHHHTLRACLSISRNVPLLDATWMPAPTFEALHERTIIPCAQLPFAFTTCRVHTHPLGRSRPTSCCNHARSPSASKPASESEQKHHTDPPSRRRVFNPSSRSFAWAVR